MLAVVRISSVVSFSGDVINFVDVIVDDDNDVDDGGSGGEVKNGDVINDDDVTMCSCVIALATVDVVLKAIDAFGAVVLVFSRVVS